jgi:hypothetical protein
MGTGGPFPGSKVRPHWIGDWVGAPEPVWTQGLEEKSSAPVGDRTPIVQPVVRHYTTWATAAPNTQFNPPVIPCVMLIYIIGPTQKWHCIHFELHCIHQMVLLLFPPLQFIRPAYWYWSQGIKNTEKVGWPTITFVLGFMKTVRVAYDSVRIRFHENCANVSKRIWDKHGDSINNKIWKQGNSSFKKPVSEQHWAFLVGI